LPRQVLALVVGRAGYANRYVEEMKKEVLPKANLAHHSALDHVRSRNVVGRLLLNLICVLLLACHVHAQSQQKASDKSNQYAAVETLRSYLELRLNGADWKEYSKFITWPDEPAWDCNWVISKYDLGPSKKEGEKVMVSVVYMRLGLFCNNLKFELNPKVVTVNYELVKRPNGWKVNAPIPDYPDISADVLIRSLRSLAEKGNEKPERRVQAEATARKLGDVLSRTRSLQ
jgi:hypothetical protein